MFGVVDAFCNMHGASDGFAFKMKLVVEELFTNMVRHNSESPHDVSVELETEGEWLNVSMIDRDSDYFDPRDRAEVDLEARLHERTPGGLGIHLVRSMVDELDYHYANRESTITVRKRLETIAPDTTGQ